MKSAKLVRIANLVLCAGALACLGLLVIVFVRRQMHPPGTLWKYYLGLSAGLLFFSFSLRWSAENRIRLVLLCTSIVFALYACELILIALAVPDKFDVTQELVAKGVNASPVINPSAFIPSNGLSGIFPLAGIANRQAVYCNESGHFSIYPSDEHGFNNPRWESNPEIVLVGDSFAQGACVDPGADIASQLRRSGSSVLTLGGAGNGPLIELATLREYAAHLKPKTLLWVYYEGNDLPDLKIELSCPLLRRYFSDDNFRQNLIERQGEIDQAVSNYIDEVARSEKDRDRLRGRVWDAIRLTALRTRWAIIAASYSPPDEVTAAPDADFTHVLQKANEQVEGWGGRMYFVYLPSYGRYSHAVNGETYAHRQEVLDLIRHLNIPLIDGQQVFVTHPDPLSLFPNRSNGHYTPQGYHLVADYIQKSLPTNR